MNIKITNDEMNNDDFQIIESNSNPLLENHQLWKEYVYFSIYFYFIS
jgi:hypothetical protein